MKTLMMRLAAVAAGLVLVIAIYRPWDDGNGVSGDETHKSVSAYAEQETHACEPEEERSGKERRKQAVWYYYMQRQFGSPGLNTDMELFNAVRSIKAQNSVSFEKAAFEQPEWSSLGPANIGGRVRAVAFDPTDANTVYVGAASGGVFKTTDKGSHWIPTMDFASALAIGALAIDPNDAQTIFAGTGEPVAETPRSLSSPAFSGLGVMKSTNGGQDWSLLTWGAKSAIHRIIVSPVSNDTLLVASTSGLRKTTDGGANWTTVLSGNITDIVAKADNDNILFAARGDDEGSAANGIWRSFGNGADTTWERLDVNFPDGDSVGRVLLAVTPADPNVMMAFFSRAMEGGFPVTNDYLCIMKSTDGGDSWFRMNASGINSNLATGQLFYDFCAVISPFSADTVYLGGYQLLRSVNGGVTWQTNAASYYVHVDHHFVAYHPLEHLVWDGNDGGVYYRRGNGSWISLENNFESVQYYTIAVDPQRPWQLYGGSQDNGTHKLANKTAKNWDDNFNTGDGGYVIIDPRNSDVVISTVTAYQGIFRTTNGGQTQQFYDNGLFTQGTSEYAGWIAPMALHPASYSSTISGGRLYYASQYMYVADNIGTQSVAPSFSLLSSDRLVRGGQYESVVTSIAISPLEPDFMFVGSGDYGIFRTNNLLDGPGNVAFEDITNSIPRWITRVYADPFNEHVVYVTYSGYNTGHVYRSSNRGTNWVNISNDLPNIPVNDILVHPDYPEVLFIATDAGVYYSTNTGENWQQFGTALPYVVVSDISFTSDDEGLYLIAATYGRGMWSVRIESDIVSAHPVPKPDVVALDQCYPNPVRSGTTARIRYSIPDAGNVTITLYNSVGKRIRTIMDTRNEPGTSVTEISTRGLVHGIYYYQMQAGSKTVTKKMLVTQ